MAYGKQIAEYTLELYRFESNQSRFWNFSLVGFGNFFEIINTKIEASNNLVPLVTSYENYN